MKTAYLVFDIGTSAIKCGSVTPSLSIVKVNQCHFPLKQRDGFVTVDFKHVLQLCLKLMNDVVKDTNSEGFEIDALLIASQA